MANLVPLHIDKETGKVVATHNVHLTLPTAVPPGIKYCVEAVDASTTWVINHNQDKDFIYQIFDDNMLQVFPNKVEILDSNTVEIGFNSPQSGCASLIFYADIGGIM